MFEQDHLARRIATGAVSFTLLLGAGAANAQEPTGGAPVDLGQPAPAQGPSAPALGPASGTSETTPVPSQAAPNTNPATPSTTPSGIHHGTCPLPDVITPKDVSNTSCERFLVRQLYGSVYKDPDKKLAVAAYESQTGAKKVDGIMDVDTAINIMQGKEIDTVTSPDPKATEKELFFDKRKQLATLLGTNAAGKIVVQAILKGSSGTELNYVGPDGIPAKADTPPGTYNIFSIGGRKVKVPLGIMYWPHFFQKRDGIAVHGGDVNTNTLGLSHGCIHISMTAMQKIVNPFLTMGTRVKVHGKTRTAA